MAIRAFYGIASACWAGIAVLYVGGWAGWWSDGEVPRVTIAIAIVATARLCAVRAGEDGP